MMYCEWYGICDFVVLSVIEICDDYGRVYVFHVCLNFGVVYGVGVCVNMCGVVCIVVCCLFLTSGCCLLCCDFCLICDACNCRCSFMGSVCVSIRRVDVVCLCLLYTQLLFRVRCFVLSVVC